MGYTTHVTVSIYAVYVVMAAMLSAVIMVAAVFYKSRKPVDLDQLECEQQAKLFSPHLLAPQLIMDTCPRPVQPLSLKNKLSPWKSSSQHIIDTLKPENVSEYRGKLNFSIAFEKEISTVHVHILEAVDLPVKDITGSSDPYVRVFFLEDPSKSERTKVHRRNLNPKFQQTLSFPERSGEAVSQSLQKVESKSKNIVLLLPAGNHTKLIIVMTSGAGAGIDSLSPIEKKKNAAFGTDTL